MVREKLTGYLSAERLPILERMVEVESCEDARPVNLVEPVFRIFESMSMHSVIKYCAVNNNVYFASTEEVRHQIGHCT